MINSFPREVGPPRRIVNNKKEYLNYINSNNGVKKAVYRSVYSFEETTTKYGKDIPIYESAKVDCIFFDMDDKECNAWEECNKLHQECLKENTKHSIVMSGRGYHFYIYSGEYKPQFIKSTIYNAQMFYINKLKIKVDRQVIGNPAQLARVPNTYNIRARRFCIPLTIEQFEKGDEFCKNLALKQNFVKNIYIGENLLNMKQFDNQTWDEKDNLMFMENINTPSSENIELKDLPLCIDKILKNKEARYKERGIVILYLKEKGYSKQEIYSILRKHLSEKKFKHCVVEEKQLQYLYDVRDDLVFPSCETIKKDGLCCQKCPFYKNQQVYK